MNGSAGLILALVGFISFETAGVRPRRPADGGGFVKLPMEFCGCCGWTEGDFGLAIGCCWADNCCSVFGERHDAADAGIMFSLRLSSGPVVVGIAKELRSLSTVLFRLDLASDVCWKKSAFCLAIALAASGNMELMVVMSRPELRFTFGEEGLGRPRFREWRGLSERRPSVSLNRLFGGSGKVSKLLTATTGFSCLCRRGWKEREHQKLDDSMPSAAGLE